jgi:hypothetical protein
MGESFLPRETFPRFLFPEGEALGNAALCEVTESLGSRSLLPSAGYGIGVACRAGKASRRPSQPHQLQEELQV